MTDTNTAPTTPSPQRPLERLLEDISSTSREGAKNWELVAFSAFALGIIASVFYAKPNTPEWLFRFSLLFVVACAAWMSGAMIGFLFGVPRYKAEGGSAIQSSNGTMSQRPASLVPNTNLEQISDWLTKIIVGVTLVQSQPILANFVLLCQTVGKSMGGDPTPTFIGGLIVFLFFAGLLWGYLWCYLTIFAEMVKTVKKQDQDTTIQQK